MSTQCTVFHMTALLYVRLPIQHEIGGGFLSPQHRAKRDCPELFWMPASIDRPQLGALIILFAPIWVPSGYFIMSSLLLAMQFNSETQRNLHPAVHSRLCRPD